LIPSNAPGLDSYVPEAMNEAAGGLLARILALAPEIAARADEIEAARAMPPDLIEVLRSTGVFRIFVPHSHGGLELDFPTATEIIAALAKIDGSVGWTVMIGGGGALVASLLRKETYEQVYRHGPDVIIAASGQPAGTAEPAPGGWCVNGRWPFASGASHADWIMALCVMTERRPIPSPGGEVALMRGFIMPARCWHIEDTWRGLGLRGTASNHISLKNTTVHVANFFDFPSGQPCLPGPLYQAIPQLIPLTHSAVVVGIAEGALEELVVLANTGRRQQRATVAIPDSELFRVELGRIAAGIRAARAFLREQAKTHWCHALAGTLNDEGLQIQATQTAIWVATTCVQAVDACFALGGSSVVYENSSLQRRLRDLRTAAQHAAVQQRLYTRAGKLLLDGSFVRPQAAAP
jgi:indole-3-acetate monooxygenase